MPRGDKSSYSDKQRRQAAEIEKSYARSGSGKERAERIAWATVNKQDGGARGRRKSGSASTSTARAPKKK